MKDVPPGLYSWKLWGISSKNVCAYTWPEREGAPRSITSSSHRADKAQIGSTYPDPSCGCHKGAPCRKLLIFLSVQYFMPVGHPADFIRKPPMIRL